MIGWKITSETYVLPYYVMIQGKEKWGKELKDKIQLKKVSPSPNFQPLQCNPFRLFINDFHSMITEPPILRHCGLGSDFIGDTDTIGSFT
jgi:hypothetical protein